MSASTLRIGLTLLVIALLVVMPWVFQAETRSPNTCTNITNDKLNFIASFIVQLNRDGHTIASFHSVADMLAAAQQEGYIVRSEKAHYLVDGWNEPLRWQVKKRGTATVLRVISAGPNRTYENGEGDDIYLEAVICGRADPEIRFKPERKVAPGIFHAIPSRPAAPKAREALK